MQPIGTDKKDSGYAPKYRHFPEGGEIVIFNPLDRDIIYNVATDLGTFGYILKKNKRSVVQGGMVATLGVKLIVDELITRDPNLASRVWDLDVRAKFEKDVILREKLPVQHNINHINPDEPIDLSEVGGVEPDDEPVELNDEVLNYTGENFNDDEIGVADEEDAFPDLGKILSDSISQAPKLTKPVETGEDQD